MMSSSRPAATRCKPLVGCGTRERRAGRPGAGPARRRVPPQRRPGNDGQAAPVAAAGRASSLRPCPRAGACHQPASSATMARSRAASARGLAATSAADGFERRGRPVGDGRLRRRRTAARAGRRTRPRQPRRTICFIEPVLARVVADHRAHAPDARCDKATGQRGTQLAELVVDVDAQRLEHPAGRVTPATRPPPGPPRPRPRPAASVEVSGRAATIARAMRPDSRPSPFSRNSSARASSDRVLTRSAAVTPVGRVHPHVERAVACGTRSPRSARSS